MTNFRNPDMAKILRFPTNHFVPSITYRIEVSEIITFNDGPVIEYYKGNQDA